MMKRKILLALAALVLSGVCAHAQRWAVGTNAVDWGFFGTANVEASVAAARHVTINVGARYNPWSFGQGEKQINMKQRTFNAGLRYWPWNVYSGWWCGVNAQYMEYNQGGLFKRRTEEGDAVGAAVRGGYTLMLQKHLNIEFGVSVWGGHAWYTAYQCQTCGPVVGQGRKWFVQPDDIMISLVWIF